MQAGRLDRLITIQRNTPSFGDDGHPIESWSTLGPLRRTASVTPVSGDERFTAPQYIASEQVEFRTRYAQVVADLTPLDRIIYPALTEVEAAASPPADIQVRRIYDVLTVAEIGRREGLSIKAARRSDVTP